MASLLKNWAVRQLANALADYLEGVTPDSVHASLGRDVGTLNLRARVSPAALRPFRLEVVDSEVDLDVRIPWRHLESQPTEFAVQAFRLEVRLASGRSSRSEADLRSRRDAKLAAVQRLTDAAGAADAESGTGAEAGRAARASHAILRQLRASLRRVEISLNREEWREEPVSLCIQEVDLQSVGADWTSPPDPSQEDLNKVFRFRELSVFSARQRGPAAAPAAPATPQLGPLALEVRLLHSQPRQLLHVWAETGSEASCVRIDPDVARFFRRIISVVLAPDPEQVEVAKLSESAGHEYAKLYLRRICGESFDETRLADIEDTAPVSWIAAWRNHVHRLQKTPSAAASEVRPSSVVQEEGPRKPKRRDALWSWFAGRKEDEEAPPPPESKALAPRSGTSFSDTAGFEDLLEAAIEAGLAPEVSLPKSIVLDASVPRVEALCTGAASQLKLGLEGMALHAEVRAKAPKECQSTPHLWQASSRVELGTFSVLLDGEHLVELRKGERDSAADKLMDGIEDASSLGLRKVSDGMGEDSSAVYLELTASQRDVLVDGSPPFDLSVFFSQGPVTFRLIARRVNGALSNILEVWDAFQEQPDVLASGQGPGQPGRAPLPSSLPPDGSDEEGDEDMGIGQAAAAVLADKQGTLKLHLHVEAPIIRLEDAQSERTIVIHCGILRVRTQRDPIGRGSSEEIVPAESVRFAELGVFCELIDQSIVLVERGSNYWVYEPATALLRGGLAEGSSSVHVRAEAPKMRFVCFPRLIEAVGELKWGLDYALAPLSRPEAPAAPSTDGAPAAEDSDQPAAQEGAARRRASTESSLQVELACGLFEMCWSSHDGTSPEILLGSGATQIRILKAASETTVSTDMTRLRLEAGGQDLVQCQEALRVRVESGPAALEVQIDAPPVILQWAVDPVLAALQAIRSAEGRFSQGMASAGRLLPLSEDTGMSTLLWNRYVLERAERLGEDVTAYVQAELEQLGPDAPPLQPPPPRGAARAAAAAASAAPAAVAAEGSGPAGGVEEAAQPRAVRLTTTFTGLTVDVVANRRRSGAVPARLVASDAKLVLEWVDGGASATVTLASVSLDLGPRRVLTPRSQDVDLLCVAAAAERGKAPTLKASWAQVVYVYRQRDVDELVALVKQDVVGAISRPSDETPTEESQPVVERTPSRAASATVGRLQYRFTIKAPLVYIPTDAYSHSAQASGDGAPHIAARLAGRRSIEQMLITGARRRPLEDKVAYLEAVDGEVEFNPAPGDGFLVIDFGHLDIRQGDSGGTAVDLELREVRVLAQVGDEPRTDVLHPLCLGVTVGIDERDYDVKAWLPLEDSSGGYHLSLTRSYLTLILDLACLNINYSSVGADSPRSRRASSISEDRAASPSSLSIRFQLTWRGPLRFDLSFTHETQIASLELVDGSVDYASSAEKMRLDVQIRAITGKDTRFEVRNVDKGVLEGVPLEPGAQAFRLISEIPAVGDSHLEVTLEHPVLLVLPALFTDLSTWGLSAYQQSAMYIVPARAAVGSAVPVTRKQAIEVLVQNAAIKIPVSWDEPSNFMEITGGVNASLIQTGSLTQIKHLDLIAGKLRRAVSGGPPTLLCGRLEVATRGTFESTQDEDKGIRLNTLSFEFINIQPLRLCLDASQLRALTGAVMELARLDAESAEPAEELRQRDPLALVLRQRFAFAGSIEVNNVLVQFLESSGTRGARASLEVEGACPLVQVSFTSTVGSAPSMSLLADRLHLGVRSYNERVGEWEPVLAPSKWHIAYTAYPEKHGSAFTLRFPEHTRDCLDSKYQDSAVERAWYGDRNAEWSSKRGLDVTANVKRRLAEGRAIRASNDLFGDPVLGVSKVLLVELRQKAVRRIEMSSEPIKLVATIPLLSMLSRIGGRESVASTDSHAGNVVLGLNLTGLTCFVGSEGLGGGQGVELPPTSSPLPLDEVLHGWDGLGPLPRIMVWQAEGDGVEAQEEVASSSSGRGARQRRRRCCEFNLEAEGTHSCRGGASSPHVVVRVIALRPLQRLVLVTTPLHISNRTPRDVEVRFLSAASHDAFPVISFEAAVGQPRCIPAWQLDPALERAPKPEEVIGPSKADLSLEKFVSQADDLSRACQNSSSSLKSLSSPFGARRVSGALVVEILCGEGLENPEYRVGDHIKKLLPVKQQLSPYVTVTWANSQVQQTQVKQANRNQVVFRERLMFSLPEGSTVDAMRGKALSFEVYHRAGIRAVVRGDPKVGSAQLALGDEELSQGQGRLKTLCLLRDGKRKGQLMVRVGLDVTEDAGAECSPSGSPAAILKGKPMLALAGAGLLERQQEGVYTIPSGWILAVPPDALSESSSELARCFLQLRPAGAGGGPGDEVTWGTPLDSSLVTGAAGGVTSISWLPAVGASAGGKKDPAAASAAASDSSAARARGGGAAETPACCRFLLETGSKGEGCQDIVVDAPLRIANACPCNIYCALGKASTKHVGEDSNNCNAEALLRILDGAGGLWEVGPQAFADIYPLRPDSNQQVSWDVGTGQREKLTCRSGANRLLVARRGSRIVWRFERVEALDVELGPFRLSPQEERCVFDLPVDGLVFSVALQEQFSGARTAWSTPLPTLVPPLAASQAGVRPKWDDGFVELGVAWQPGQRTVIFAKHWFADATGLGVGLSRSVRHRRLPCFGNDMSLFAEVHGENPQVCLSLPGEKQTEVQIPVVGGSSRVQLSPVHSCALMAELVASASTFGISCKLLTVVPGLMVFSDVEGCEVGFRQQGCKSMVWLGCGDSSHLYWDRADKPKQVEVAVREAKADRRPELVWSTPFEVAERGIGAFPLVFAQESHTQRLVCIQIDQSGELFTLAAAGEAHCHQLVNKHPCLVLDAHVVGNRDGCGSRFVVPFGESFAFGRSAGGSAAAQDCLRLMLTDTADGTCSRTVDLSLERASEHRVAELCATVSVQLRARVAVVVVSPVATAASRDIVWGFEFEVAVPHLSVALVTERPPRGEAFGLTLAGFEMRVRQTAAGLQDSQLEVQRFQVDVQRPPMVVLASVESPVLRLDCAREDVAARDAVLRRLAVQLGRLEVTADDALLLEATALAGAMRSALAGASGGVGSDAPEGSLGMRAAISRAGVPYNLTCGGPPPPSSKCILYDLSVSPVMLRIFCRLSLRLLPDWLTALVTVLSLSTLMEVDGANLKLPDQRFFSREAPFEGSLGALAGRLSQHYTKLYPRAIISLVNNSNLILGGLLSRHRFFPKDRKVQQTAREPLPIINGIVQPMVQDLQEFLDAPAYERGGRRKKAS